MQWQQAGQNQGWFAKLLCTCLWLAAFFPSALEVLYISGFWNMHHEHKPEMCAVYHQKPPTGNIWSCFILCIDQSGTGLSIDQQKQRALPQHFRRCLMGVAGAWTYTFKACIMPQSWFPHFKMWIVQQCMKKLHVINKTIHTITPVPAVCPVLRKIGCPAMQHWSCDI